MRLVMDILSNPVFTIVPFALWAALIAAVVFRLAESGAGSDVPLRSARDLLEEHLTRHDIDREEYVDRRKALDHITAMVWPSRLPALPARIDARNKWSRAWPLGHDHAMSAVVLASPAWRARSWPWDCRFRFSFSWKGVVPRQIFLGVSAVAIACFIKRE
jgi:hypothetical protein